MHLKLIAYKLHFTLYQAHVLIHVHCTCIRFMFLVAISYKNNIIGLIPSMYYGD